MNRFNRWFLILLTIILGLLLGNLFFSVFDNPASSIQPISWSHESRWIGVPKSSYQIYARHTFYLPDSTQHSWLRISADNDFTLYVNGKKIIRENSIFDNSLGFKNSLTDRNQGFNDSKHYEVKINRYSLMTANFKNWKMSTYVDLNSYLVSGKNVLGLEIQKSQENPRVVIEGYIYPTPESPPIVLTTGIASWKVSALPENRQELRWFETDFPDQNWAEAKIIASVQENTYSRLSRNIYDFPLQGSQITGNTSNLGEVWLRGIWINDLDQYRSFLRFNSNNEYDLLLNGHLINHSNVNSKNLNMQEITNLLHKGNNYLAVRLTKPLEPEQQNNLDSSGIIKFFLDGWSESKEGKIVSVFSSNPSWESVSLPVLGWTEGTGVGKPVGVLGEPDKNLKRVFLGNASLMNFPDYLLHNFLWSGLGVFLTIMTIYGCGYLLRSKQKNSQLNVLVSGAVLLVPGTFFLIGVGLLKHRYAESETGLLFAQPQTNPLVLMGFVGIFLITLLCVRKNLTDKENIHSDQQAQLRQSFPIWSQWLLLGLIVGVGFILRLHNLGDADVTWDEGISMDATRGILRTGEPIATSGVWYSRSPFYHYMLALWLRIFGDTPLNARILNVAWGTSMLVLIYLFAKELTGKVWIALLITTVLALDPFLIWYSRFIRFYQVVQVMTLLSFWFFIKGFIDKVGKKYQYYFFISVTIMLLNQELNVTFIPCFLIGFLYFYRPFKLFKEIPMVLGGLMCFCIYTFNASVFVIKTLTPIVAQSSRTVPQIRLHLSDVSGFLSILFVGATRMSVIYALFFFLGFVYFLKKRNGKLVFLCSSILINIGLLTILAFDITPRYLYSNYWLFITVTIYGAICIAESLGNRISQILPIKIPMRNIALGFTLIILFCNLEFGRVLSSYEDVIAVQNDEVFRYIKRNLQSGDIVISNYPPAALTNGVKLNYNLSKITDIDFADLYLENGLVVNRGAGSIAINSLDQLPNILSNANRVWIHQEQFLEERLPNSFVNYFQTLGIVVMKPFGSSLRLWEPYNGIPQSLPNEGKDIGSY